jgi:hypothetical protein
MTARMVMWMPMAHGWLLEKEEDPVYQDFLNG